MKNILWEHSLKINAKNRLLRYYVFPVALYEMKGCIFTDNICKRRNALEMWIYRGILRMPLALRNEEVFPRINTETERKLEYRGYIMRGEKYELTVDNSGYTVWEQKFRLKA